MDAGAAARRRIIPDLDPSLPPGLVPPNVLFENRSLVAFSVGNEHQIAICAHFLFETRPMIEFEIGHAGSSGSFRYLCRGRDLDFPYTNFRGLSIEKRFEK